MAARQNKLPDGWLRVSSYCIRSGDYTICKIGSADGWKYELWHLSEQISVNLLTLDESIEVHRERLLSTRI